MLSICNNMYMYHIDVNIENEEFKINNYFNYYQLPLHIKSMNRLRNYVNP